MRLPLRWGKGDKRTTSDSPFAPAALRYTARKDAVRKTVRRGRATVLLSITPELSLNIELCANSGPQLFLIAARALAV